MTETSPHEQINQCIGLFQQVNQCSSFVETGAIILASVVGVILAAVWSRGVARRRAALDLLLGEEIKPEWIEQRTKFNKLLIDEKGDLAKYATEANSSSRNAVVLRTVLNQYEVVSIAIHRKIIDEKSYHDWCRSTLVADWIGCKKFVEKLRENEGKIVYFEEFEKLAKRWAATPEEKRFVGGDESRIWRFFRP